MIFTDNDLEKLLKSIDTNHERPWWQKNIRGLVSRLKAAEDCVELAQQMQEEQVWSSSIWLKFMNIWLEAAGK